MGSIGAGMGPFRVRSGANIPKGHRTVEFCWWSSSYSSPLLIPIASVLRGLRGGSSLAVRQGCVRRRGDGTWFWGTWNARVGGSDMHLQPNRMSLHDSCAVEQGAHRKGRRAPLWRRRSRGRRAALIIFAPHSRRFGSHSPPGSRAVLAGVDVVGRRRSTSPRR